MEIMYLCDAQKNKDCKKTYCKFFQTGECRHTTNKKFRLNDRDGALFVQASGILIEYECLDEYIKEQEETKSY